ncbi:MFS transporter [Sulfitobacter sp. LCG007]
MQHFAILAALEAGIRGTLMSVMPLMMYRAYQDAGVVSRLYLAVGIASLLYGLMVPYVSRRVPRRWMYTLGAALYLSGMTLALTAPAKGMVLVLGLNAMGTVTLAICLNAYVLDYIARQDLGQSESMRMVYSAVPWAGGPFIGVLLLNWWEPAPFIVAGGFALAVLAAFWWLRLGNGKQITRAAGPAPNPLAFLGRFARQPRLIAGWLFAVMRSCGWWVYVVYMPIFCIQSGLGETIGAVGVSAANAFLFLTPLMLKLVHRVGVRRAVRSGFLFAGIFFAAGWAFAGWPWLGVASLLVAASSLILLDVCGGLPFLMAVKPSERTEMAAVYSTFRDVSGILTPAMASLVLLVAPLSFIFATCAAGMLATFAVAGRLHPRLGERRPPGRKDAARAEPAE